MSIPGPAAPQFQRDVPLAPLTTLGVGGRARYFVECSSVKEIQGCLAHAERERLRVQILGGGSNIIFPDDGFAGLVLKVGIRGISLSDDGSRTAVTAGAGEPWDPFVLHCIGHDLGGVECLSGIPGYVGATPIQNVGAYGQEVSDTVESLNAIDRRTLREVRFASGECDFAYRQSRFKSRDADRYVITSVTFRLPRGTEPVIRYKELQVYLESLKSASEPGVSSLQTVRDAVLALRRRKSMVIDPQDPNSRSVGSFFMNPVLSAQEFEALRTRWNQFGSGSPIPTFDAPGGVKVPAAWLVEQAGFKKGLQRGGAGISANHALAIINRGGTAQEILELAVEIQKTVFDRFGIRLDREPVVVS